MPSPAMRPPPPRAVRRPTARQGPAPARSPAASAAIAVGLALAVAAGALPAPAAAQTGAVPACSANRAGTQACVAGTLCDCRYDRGGALSGQPPGWRWDCGILRPRCGSAGPGLPATINPYAGPWPNSVVIDRSTDSTVITNDARAVQSNQQQTGDGTIQGGGAGGDQRLQDSPVAAD